MQRETWALQANARVFIQYLVQLDVFDPTSETSRVRFITFFERHLTAQPYGHLCHFLVKRVLEMAQSAVCR